MTSINTAVRPDLGFATPNNKQSDAENQRESWLRQMEMSQIALLQQTGTQNGQVFENNSSSGNPHLQGEQMATPQIVHSGQKTLGAEGVQPTLLPVHPIVSQHQQASVEISDSAQNAAVPTVATATTAPVMVNTPVAPLAAVAAVPTVTTAATAATAPVMANAPVAPLAPAVSLTAASPAAQIAATPRGKSSAAAQTTSISGASTGPTAQLAAAAPQITPVQAATAQAGATPEVEIEEKQTLPQEQSSTNVASSLLRAASETISQPAEEGSDVSETESPTGETPETGGGEDWQKRLIHVAQNGQNVSVSIRDIALEPHQSAQIISRLADDVAQSGLRLYNATVNGKTVLKQTKTSGGTIGASAHTLIASLSENAIGDTDSPLFQDIQEQ